MHRPHAAAGRATPLVLVVEDDPDSREMYEFGLSAMGLDVLGARDASDALRQASDVRPDVIVTDLSMPGIDGCEFAERIRLDAHLGATPVLALTGWVDKRQAERAEQSGFAAIIEKPCPPDILALHIRRALSNVSADALDGGIYRQGEACPLGACQAVPQEFDIFGSVGGDTK